MKLKTLRKCVLAGGAACFLLIPLNVAAAQEEPAEITEHHIELEGKLLNYTAEAGRIAIRDVETGEPHGYMFYTAYRVPSARGPRPLAFLWNGGPGANSSLLHFYVAGPKRVEGDRLVDDAETWLRVADLVFVDPIGTGFSRPAKSAYDAEFYGTLGDTASVTEFVRCWRLLHDVVDAPVYLIGESWGAPRAATVAYALEKRGIRVNGLVLISGGTSLHTQYCPPPLAEALRVVDLALRAQYYGKTPAEFGKDSGALRKAVEDWARRTYAPALAHLDKLSESERASIIDHLSRFTGLPVNQIDPKTLSIAPRQFLTSLLKDQGRALQTLDTRKSVSAGSTTISTEDEAAPAILSYFREDLGYRTDLPYVELESLDQGYAPSGKYPETVNSRWNYATAPITPAEMNAIMAAAAARGSGPPQFGPPLPATEEAIALNPGMKVLVASGEYDSYASCAVNEETARRLPPKLQALIKFKCYVGGHAMYLDPPARLELTKDVEAFLTGAQ